MKAFVILYTKGPAWLHGCCVRPSPIPPHDWLVHLLVFTRHQGPSAPVRLQSRQELGRPQPRSWPSSCQDWNTTGEEGPLCHVKSRKWASQPGGRVGMAIHSTCGGMLSPSYKGQQRASCPPLLMNLTPTWWWWCAP